MCVYVCVVGGRDRKKVASGRMGRRAEFGAGVQGELPPPSGRGNGVNMSLKGIPLPALPAAETQRSAGTCSSGATSNRAAAAVTKQNLKGVGAV